MKRIENNVMEGKAVSEDDAVLWNDLVWYVRGNYDVVFAGEFDAIYMGTPMKAICLKLQFDWRSYVGLCTLKVLIMNIIVGQPNVRELYNDKDNITGACLDALRDIIDGERLDTSSRQDGESSTSPGGSGGDPDGGDYSIFVDLISLPCDPPEDLSLCTQYVSSNSIF